MLIAAAFLASQSPAPVQLMDLESLSPSRVGELVLSERPHREIVAIEKFRGWTFGGEYTVLLYESPIRQGQACNRKMWKATFRLPGQDWKEGTPIGLRELEPTDQVALTRVEPCELADYASLGAAVHSEEGITLLSKLREVSENSKAYSIQCSDETGSNLCRDIEFFLRFSTASTIGKSGPNYTAILYGMGKPAQIFVTMNLSGDKQVQIEGKGPPPPF